MWKKLLCDKLAVLCLIIICGTIVVGILAPFVAPHDPLASNIMNKFKPMSLEYPFGTDQQGRCVFSRLLYGISPTILLSLLTMVCTIFLGAFWGIISGYSQGILDECIMRICDILLSFPSQVMILAIVGILGVGIENVVIANVLVTWAWYARMIRSTVLLYREKNYVLFSRTSGTGIKFILCKHMLPAVLPEIIILASLNTGWVIINISTLSFLGLGIQAPQPEWGAMLNEARHVLTTHPEQMLAPGLSVLILVAAFNLLGDCMRDALEIKGAGR